MMKTTTMFIKFKAIDKVKLLSFCTLYSSGIGSSADELQSLAENAT